MIFGNTCFSVRLRQSGSVLLLCLCMSSAAVAEQKSPTEGNLFPSITLESGHLIYGKNDRSFAVRSHSKTFSKELVRVAQAEPPLISPYTWSAVRNENGTLVLNGYVPDAQTQSSLHALAGNHAVDSTSLARGAPDLFESNATDGLKALLKLKQGSVNFRPEGWVISGEAASTSIQEEITSDLNGLGPDWEIAILVSETSEEEGSASDLDNQASADEAITVDPYLWAAERGENGSFVLSGYVPTPQLQRYISVRAGNVVSDTMEVADGAPNDFIQTLLTGFTALSSLEEGRLAYTGTGWVLIGRASSEAVKDATISSLGAAVDISDWQISIAALPPLVVPYVWEAAKNPDGSIVISGNVPTPQLQRYLTVRAGEDAENQVKVTPGAPDGFVSDALAALTALQLLERGEVKFDGETWSVNGEVSTEQAIASVVGSLATAETDTESWVISVAATVAAEEVSVGQTAEPPVEETAEVEETRPLYPFSARKTDDQIIMSGQVPAEATRNYLSVIAGGASPNGLRIGENPPENFILDAVAGLRALRNLQEGRLRHAEDGWSLTGLARSEGQREGALASIDANWNTDIALVPAETVCREDLETLSEENGILFAPASARITDSSSVTIDHVVEILTNCPETAIHVEGHTDSDGDEQANLILSLARSEAVISELVTRGISDTRLYAVAYGESLPIAPNNTSAGKSRNRRIVFKVVTGEE